MQLWGAISFKFLFNLRKYDNFARRIKRVKAKITLLKTC